jgi:hypothetical protein
MNERWQTAFLVVSLCVLAALGLTPLIAVFRLGTDLAATWIIVVFQVVITVLGVVVGTAVTYYVTQSVVLAATSKALKKIDDLRQDHEDLVNKVALRAPPFAVGILLITQAVLYLADKSFEKDVATTVCVTLVLIIVFWLANELAAREDTRQRIVGTLVWVGGILFLPLMILLHENCDFRKVWGDFQSMPLGVECVAVLTFVAALLAPYALLEQRRRSGPRTP